MKKIASMLLVGLMVISISPLLGKTCTTDEKNNVGRCIDNTTSPISKIAAKNFLNNLRNGSMDLHGNKLVHSVLTPSGDVSLNSSLLRQNFGSYNFVNERNTLGWYSYDVRLPTKTQKLYEPTVPRIYATNISNEE
ncbi:MAG: hypothetical protein APG08_00136 [Candidatus Methanofastidiosum methylothiophilum]|jgi:hypothetical protein|uniref:Uncharacterized protein n=1 Tax=Candidatus Methanofastidiosum methylothiophilum TaxID=1705564 RepID=A0A150JE67_9EURY|nr:MAG: hypothetical protein AN188_00173 [Candidatus Methanofastidiosum methylthiophilus]MBP6931988.1 hypothetical protein [Methanofastidiosum sp.]OQC52805.1 MAG: hypothetical protein BWX56_00038 [Euryarchaeota archaeon ADurb.Bin023]KYC57666.1 MAG: hypothetical protein APG08_00136 [Candidatus Methanofastidiosum methylthiophilus]KYC58444.1 MAG: hypothetical protein APG09_00190 [Candidatus Methanofastidiosum methylthiophilus]